MITSKEHFHGSDLEKIEALYGIKKEELVNFAGNVNPLGISPLLRQSLSERIDAITEYPDREYTSLRQSITDYLNKDRGTGSPINREDVLVGNGSTELISLMIQFISPSKALILSPTYSEYERELTLAGSKIDYFPLKEKEDFRLDCNALKAKLAEGYQLLVICNPNNPTSSAINKDTLADVLSCCQENNVYCMVDETYVEFAPAVNAITAVSLISDYSRLIIIRGISKFFAAPGLRLGYAVVGDKELIAKVNRRKNPWTINTLASLAGEIMFADENYIHTTRAFTQKERQRVVTALKDITDIKFYEPSANFLLLQVQKDSPTSYELFEGAIKKGMLLRDCSNFPLLNSRFIRFCFMSEEANSKLLEYLKESLS